MATDTELALLAYWSYGQSQKNQIELTTWEEDRSLTRSTPSGFAASVYAKGSEVVIAFRGTETQTVAALFDDFWNGNIPAADGEPSQQVIDAIKLVADTIASNPGKTITLTGHSLGGGLASVMSSLFGLKSVVFDPAPFGATAYGAEAISTSPPHIIYGGLLQTYFDSYVSYQQSQGRGDDIDAMFSDYVAALSSTDAAVRDAMYAQRAQNVSGYYLQDEILTAVRAQLPTVMAPGGLTQIDIGSTTMMDGASDAVSLHSMSLLLAMMASPDLRAASAQLPNLIQTIIDPTLYFHDDKSDQTNFLNRLLQEQVRDGVNTPDTAIDKFAADVLKLGGNSGIAQSYGLLRDSLLIAAIEYYNFRDLSQATNLFTVANGGIHFKYSDIGAEEYKSLPKLAAAVAPLADPLDASLVDKLKQQNAWHVQIGDGSMNWTASALDPQNDVAIGGTGSDSFSAGAGDDILIGNAGSDGMEGGDANDRLYGGADNDFLYGDAGNDVLYGGLNDDLLSSGSGRDTLDGGSGFDTYQINLGETSATIRDSDGSGSIQIEKPDHSFYSLGTGIHEVSAGSGSYEDDQHNRYRKSGNDLIIQIDQGGQVIAIENFATMSGDKLGMDLQGPNELATSEPQFTFTGNDDPNAICLVGGMDPVPVVAIGGGAGDVIATSDANDMLFADTQVDIQTAIANGSTGAGTPGLLYMSGANNNDFLFGYGGDDTLVGSANADVLSGGDGNDLLIGGQGDDYLDGDSYMAVRFPSNSNPTDAQTFDWVFTETNDGVHEVLNLTGTGAFLRPTAQTGGSDTIYAGGGDDVVEAGLGNDVVYGEDGNDTLWLDEGNDSALGGAGDDLIAGDSGWSGLHNPAADGSDFIDGGTGNDVLAGDGGDDVIFGGAGADYILGDFYVIADDPTEQYSGDDYLNGEDGDDRIFGNAGNDTLIGGSGNDQLKGDSDSTPAYRQGADYLDGGSGDDILWGDGGADTLIGGDGYDFLYGETATTPLSAQGNDYLDGGAQRDQLVGGGADDTLIGGDGDDDLFGDFGDNSSASAGNDYLDGGAGDDYLAGDAGSDILIGGDGQDTLLGDDGDDYLEGGAGTDVLAGGAGDDTYVFNGDDWLLQNGTADGIQDSEGNNHVVFEDVTIDDVAVAKGTETSSVVIQQGSNRAVLVHNALSGAQFTFQFADGPTFTANQLIGRKLTGSINASTSADNGYLVGGSSNDSLTATGQSASLSGGNGDDVLTGSSSKKTTYYFDIGDGNDVIYDAGNQFVGGQLQTNTVVFAEGVQSTDLKLQYNSQMGTFSITYGTGTDSIRMGNFDAGNVINGPYTIDAFKFSDGSTLTWSQLVNQQGIDIVGRTSLTGTNVGDRLVGTGANEILDGQAGNDTLDGGEGNDVLSGGVGDDTYVFGIGSGNDQIDEVGGFDRIQLQPSISTSDVTLVRTSGNEPAGYGGSGSDSLVLILNSTHEQLFVNGYYASGSDQAIDAIQFDDGTVWNATDIAARVVNQSGSADSLTGSTGNDTFVVDNPNDVITDAGDGVDQVYSSVSYTLPADVENLTLTGLLAINGIGNTSNNVIVGNASSNTLQSGGGVDTLIGGQGDDTYILDDVTDQFNSSTVMDVVIENVGEGTDTVIVGAYSGRYTLPDNVENGIAASFNVTLTGNAADNTLTVKAILPQVATDANGCVLIGGDGNDTLNDFGAYATLRGGKGSDTYHAWNTSQSATTIQDTDDGQVEDDSIDVFEFDPSLTLKDVTFSRAAINSSSTNVDLFVQQAGGNPVIVKNFFAEGTARDRIELFTFADGTYLTADDVESSLQTFGTAGDDILTARTTGGDVFGGAGNDTLNGSAGNDLLDGGTGADTMSGGAGDDLYRVDDTGDVVIENANAGIDGVDSAISYSLPDNVESLTLTGSGNFSGIGNSADNILIGNSGNNSLIGGAGNDVLDGGAGSDTLVGGDGNDQYVVDNVGDVVTEDVNAGYDAITSTVSLALPDNVESLTLAESANAIVATGNALDNSISGNSQANIIDGGLGADTMYGDAGDDTYYVDDTTNFSTGDYTKDSITENVNGGNDTVISSVSWTLDPNVENLTLTGSANLSGTGNEVANVLIGNSGNNTLSGGDGDDTLDGGAGNDTLMGGLGNDTYIVDSTSDFISESSSAGIDTVKSIVNWTLGSNLENLVLLGSGNLTGTGNSLANVITGNVGNNVLDGKAGADTLIGGLGNDTYVIDNVGDVVTENANEGTDLVQSSITYTLGSNVENLTLTGSSAINGTGNALDNVLTGNSAVNTLNGGAGNDTLNGGAGADTMIGGVGDDTYVVDNTSDVVTENANEGTDIVQSAVTFTLSNNVENLTLTGTSAINGTGNALDNYLVGNSGNNTLTGNAGNDTLDPGSAGTDTLKGGTGDDTYIVTRSTGITITENAGEGTDAVNASVTFTLPTNVELLFLTGTTAINGTGNTLANLLRGNSANNTLSGGGGTDILEGGAGNDNLSNTTGNTLLNGGAGTDTLTGGSGNDLLIGGTGNDALTTGTGADIIAFNKGDGQDTVAASTTKDNTVSIGGGALYADLLFQKVSNDLVLKIGATDQITFSGYYTSTSNRSVNVLQMIIEGTSDYAPASGNVTRDNKVERFTFDGLVSAFDAARAANPSLTTWALSNALAAQYLAGSDTAAIGGDLAYRYGRFGTHSDISFIPALGILGSASFGTATQTLQPLSGLQDPTPRLS